jgi:glycosyltransferase involved in cell wall biosynthesis
LIKVQVWLPDLRVGGSEISLLAELRTLDRAQYDVSVVILGTDLTLEPEFRAAGISVDRISSRSWWRRGIDIFQTLRHGDPDVVNTMLFWPNAFVRPLARTMGFPVLTTLVNADYGPDQRLSSKHGRLAVIIAQCIDATTARFSTRFRAVSNEVAATMSRRLHIRPSRIEVIERGRDLEHLGRRTDERRQRIRKQLNLQEKHAYVCVGRQDPQKDLETAVKAFNAMQHREDCVLLLVGRPGESTRKINDEIAKCDPGIDIRLLGERSDIGDLLAASDFFVSTSLWEGMPGAVIEAMALETPLVLSNIPSSQEVCQGRAWYFAPGDSAQCAAQMDRCVTEIYPADFLKLNRDRSVEAFSISVVTTRLQRVLRELAKVG